MPTLYEAIHNKIGYVYDQEIICKERDGVWDYRVYTIHREGREDCNDPKLACKINTAFKEWHAWVIPVSRTEDQIGSYCHWISIERIRDDYQFVNWRLPPEHNFNRLYFL